jgi:hypothetical protein
MSITNIENVSLGKILQIAFSDGVRLQISEDFKDWEMVNRFKMPISPSREFRFMFQNSLNPASVSSRNPGRGASGAFPQGFTPSVEEYSAQMKMMEATIEIGYDIWDRAKKAPEKYIQPLEMIINSTMSSTKRHLAAQLYGDGSGVIGQVSGAQTFVSGSGGAGENVILRFPISSVNAARGGVNLFEYNDILKLVVPAGTVSAITLTNATDLTPQYFKVIAKDRDNGTVDLQALTDALANVVSSGGAATVATSAASGEFFYKFQQELIPNLSGSVGDYGLLTDALTGLESLAAHDGRVVHGITMSGALAASHLSAGGNPLDVKHIHKALDKVKLAVGSGYKYPQMVMSPEALYTLIESRETDRRFQAIDDNKRGVKSFAYVHGNDTVECVSSEFCGLKRIYMIPEGKASGQKVLAYGGSDFEPIRAQNGDEFRLKVSSNGYQPAMQSVMHGYGVLICNHPAAIAKISDFTVS